MRFAALPVVGFGALALALTSLAWAQGDPTGTAIAVPGPGGSMVLPVGDLTFPGAVLAGFWMLSRTLPAALKSWKPTLRVELTHHDSSKQE